MLEACPDLRAPARQHGRCLIHGAENDLTFPPASNDAEGSQYREEQTKGDDYPPLKRFQPDMIASIGSVVSEQDYPREARDRGCQGLTLLRVTIGRDGHLKDTHFGQLTFPLAGVGRPDAG
jgi:hypothetical protein